MTDEYAAVIARVIAENKASDVLVSPLWEPVKATLVGHLGVVPERVTPTVRIIPEDTRVEPHLDADSLDVVELVMEFEEQYDLQIPDEIAEKAVTVADLINILADAIRERG